MGGWGFGEDGLEYTELGEYAELCEPADNMEDDGPLAADEGVLGDNKGVWTVGVSVFGLGVEGSAGNGRLAFFLGLLLALLLPDSNKFVGAMARSSPNEAMLSFIEGRTISGVSGNLRYGLECAFLCRVDAEVDIEASPAYGLDCDRPIGGLDIGLGGRRKFVDDGKLGRAGELEFARYKFLEASSIIFRRKIECSASARMKGAIYDHCLN